MKKILLPILITVVLLMSACITIVEKQDTKEKSTEETVIEEEELVEEEVVEEEIIEEEEVTEEEVVEPEPEPAKFVLTNLKITPDEGGTDYSISVDITNIGGLSGNYQARAKVDGEDMDLINVELGPGEKKTITLTTAQFHISEMATKYKNGETDQQTCDLSVGSLSQTITFPEPKYLLKLMYARAIIDTSNRLSVSGGVKNISDEGLQDVEVVVEFYDANKELITTESVLLYKNPLEPGQTSSFDILSSGPCKTYTIYFRFKGGNRILTDFSETDWRED